MKSRDARGRFRKTDEDLSRFGWLVGLVVVLEFAVLVYVIGALRPL